MKQFVHQCSKEFADQIIDKGDYLLNWNDTNGALNYSILTTMEQAFTYTQPDIQIPFFGRHEWYPRGGYLALLDDTYNDSVSTLNTLQLNNWIDLYTRAVFVEFGTLNANTNLFTFVELSLEFLITGDVVYRTEIQSIQLYRYLGGAGILNIAAELITLIFAIVVTVQEAINFKKEKKEYIKNMWNVITILAFFLFYVAVGLYVWKCLLTIKTVEDVKNEEGKSISTHFSSKI